MTEAELIALIAVADQTQLDAVLAAETALPQPRQAVLDAIATRQAQIGYLYYYVRQKVEGFWNLTPATLGPAIKAAVPESACQRYDDVNVAIHFMVELTAAQKTALDQAVADTEAAFDPLADAQAKRIEEFSRHTQQLLVEGFQFGGLVFGLVGDAFDNITGVYNLGINEPVFPGTFPRTFSDSTGMTAITFANAGEFMPFFQMAFYTYTYWYDTQETLDTAVRAATSVPAVNAVVDARAWPPPPPS